MYLVGHGSVNFVQSNRKLSITLFSSVLNITQNPKTKVDSINAMNFSDLVLHQIFSEDRLHFR